jgi:hypothetical protein
MVNINPGDRVNKDTGSLIQHQSQPRLKQGLKNVHFLPLWNNHQASILGDKNQTYAT